MPSSELSRRFARVSAKADTRESLLLGLQKEERPQTIILSMERFIDYYPEDSGGGAENDRLAEGKTKIIWATADSGVVKIESKDDITAGDGAKHDLLEGKAIAATTTTCNVFEYLNSRGIRTHYLGKESDNTFLARKVRMIPLELVARRIATGSYLKRYPETIEGEVFDQLVFEIFHKDDAAHDPLLKFDFERGVGVRYQASLPEGSQPLDEVTIGGLGLEDPTIMTPVARLGLGQGIENRVETLGVITRSVFLSLEEVWRTQGVQLVDLKIECGFDVETGELLVADVIDNDSWRIWPAGEREQMLDKQVYRNLAGTDDPAAKAKELGKIKNNYARVAEMTGQFVR